MKKIIKNECTSAFASAKVLCKVKACFSKFWKKYKLLVGYAIACLFAILFLVERPFSLLFFVLSLVWSFSFLSRLNRANVSIRKNSVVVMWSIFCFGLSGLLMQKLTTENFVSFGVFLAGVVCLLLYCFVPILSYYLKYNDKKRGVDFHGYSDTKFNGFVGSLFILFSVFIITGFYDKSNKENREEQQLIQQFNKEPFVSVKLVGQEMYNGTTYYILEAKGEKFYVSPFEYPDVRNVNEKSKVKVIFGNVHRTYYLKGTKKLQFKN